MASVAAILADASDDEAGGERVGLRLRTVKQERSSPEAAYYGGFAPAEAPRNGDCGPRGNGASRSPPRGRPVLRSPPRQLPPEAPHRRSPGREPYRPAQAPPPALDEAALRHMNSLLQQLQGGSGNVLPVLQQLQAQVAAATQHASHRDSTAWQHGPHAPPPFERDADRRSPRRRSRSPQRRRSSSRSRRRRSRSPPPRYRSRSPRRRSRSPPRRRRSRSVPPDGAQRSRYCVRAR
jgi:hypothetical protein